MTEIEKYESGDMMCFTDSMRTIWYSDKFLQQLKIDNEELKDTVTILRVELDKQKLRLKKYINKLEQDNVELKAYKDVNEDFRTAWKDLKEENKKIRDVNIANANVMIKLRNIIEGVEKICTEACLVGGDCRTCKCTCINKRILEVIGNWRSNGD